MNSHLSDEDKNYIKTIYYDRSLSWTSRINILKIKYNRSGRTIRRWLSQLGFHLVKEAENSQFAKAKLKKYDKKSKIFFVTWAQNATPIHIYFWNNLKKYAEYVGASVHVIAGRYKNPTSIWTSSNENLEYWSEEVIPYLDASRHDIHPYFTILSDVKVQPTNCEPLIGFEGITGDKSSIVGHPRVHLKFIPVLNNYKPKVILTTGAVTLCNYTDSSLGKKAEFHHTYGFAIVEIADDETFYVRQVTASDDGSFTDLVHHVKNEIITDVTKCHAFVAGDIHCSNLEQPVLDSAIKYLDIVKPDNLILHDVFDGESINHHEFQNGFKRYELYSSNKNLLERELNNVYDVLSKLIKYHPVVVKSNHDEFLEKWLLQYDWKKDIPNAELHLKLSHAIISGKASKGVLAYLLKEKFGESIICLDTDDSFKVMDWELAYHGHLGYHGSQGSIDQYSRLNTKVIIGDKHIPMRKNGALCVGTFSKLRLGYNKGASAWHHAGVVIHEDGKAQHIIFFKNKQGRTHFTTLI